MFFIEIGIVFLATFLLSLLYNKLLKKRSIGKSIHLALIFGLFIMMIYYIIVVIGSSTGLIPKPDYTQTQTQ